jgi:hypothetical protein
MNHDGCACDYFPGYYGLLTPCWRLEMAGGKTRDSGSDDSQGQQLYGSHGDRFFCGIRTRGVKDWQLQMKNRIWMKAFRGRGEGACD